MYAIQEETGEFLWDTQIGVSGVSPLIYDEIVYTGSYDPDRTMTPMDAETGEILWLQEGTDHV